VGGVSHEKEGDFSLSLLGAKNVVLVRSEGVQP